MRDNRHLTRKCTASVADSKCSYHFVSDFREQQTKPENPMNDNTTMGSASNDRNHVEKTKLEYDIPAMLGVPTMLGCSSSVEKPRRSELLVFASEGKQLALSLSRYASFAGTHSYGGR